MKVLQPLVLPKSLLELTAGRIREAIVSGDLPLGSKVSEQRLADLLGVSRSPVREALALLQIEGLVNVLPKRGTFVFTPDDKMVDDLCDHRAVLETACLDFAMKLNPGRLIQGLRRGIADMEKAASREDSTAYADGDRRFHLAIVEGGSNSSINKSYTTTISPLMALRTHLFTELHENLDTSRSQHAALLSACERGDLCEAKRVNSEHVKYLAEAFRLRQTKMAKAS